MEPLTLKQLCESLDISRRSVQCIENAGLLRPTDRNKYGHLLYDDLAVQRARKIKFLQAMGFKLREIGLFIDAPEPVLKEAISGKITQLECDRERMEELIVQARDWLSRLG